MPLTEQNEPVFLKTQGGVQYLTDNYRWLELWLNNFSFWVEQNTIETLVGNKEQYQLLQTQYQSITKILNNWYDDRDINDYLATIIQHELGGYRPNCSYLLDPIFHDDHGEEYYVALTPAIDAANYAAPLAFYLDKSLQTAPVISHTDSRRDVFDDLQELLRNEQKINIKILFPYNVNNIHWLSGEITIYKFYEHCVIEVYTHDPKGKGKMNEENFATLQAVIKKRISQIAPKTTVLYKNKVSPYEARQRPEDKNSCGVIVVEDILLRINGKSLDRPASLLCGASALRSQHITKIKQYLSADNPTCRNFLQRNHINDFDQILNECLEHVFHTCPSISGQLISCLQLCLNEASDLQLKQKIREAISELQNLQDLINQILASRSIDFIRRHLTYYLETQKFLMQLFPKIFELVKELNNKLLADFQSKSLKQLNNDLTEKLGEDNLAKVLSLQAEIQSLFGALKQFDLHPRQQIPQPSSPISLPKEAYSDLVLLAEIIKPENICQALARKKVVYEYFYQEMQKKLKFLTIHFGLSLTEAVRYQRIISTYENWLAILSSNKDKIVCSTVLELQNFLTLQKKAFLRQCFSEQKFNQISQVLYNFVNTKSNLSKPPKELCQILEQNKIWLKLKIVKSETQLKENWSNWQSIAATLLLGITEHPEYQLGFFATQATDEVLQRTQLPLLREPLTDSFKQTVGRASGFCFLIVSLYGAKRIGYSYQLIASLSRIPLAQINILIEMGSFIDTLSQRMGLPLLDAIQGLTPEQLQRLTERLRNVIRWDELGVIEKNGHIRWLFGLSIALLLSGLQNFIPVICAYTFATGCRDIAGYLTEYFTKYCGFSQKSTDIAKVIANITAYIYSYPYGYKFGLWLKPPPSNIPGLSQAEALSIFGLYSSSTEQDIKAKYNELTLKNHPDKCGDDCEMDMATVNEAYEVLLKKMQ